MLHLFIYSLQNVTSLNKISLDKEGGLSNIFFIATDLVNTHCSFKLLEESSNIR